jgi:hypothetical protein
VTYWVYKERNVENHNDLLPECTDIVYLITYVDDRKYIGKRAVRSVRRLKPTKAQLKIRKNYVRKELTDLPFAKYEGSHGIEGLQILKKEILYQCSTRKSSTYLESALLFEHDAIFDPMFLNLNIGGTFFDSDLKGLLDND